MLAASDGVAEVFRAVVVVVAAHQLPIALPQNRIAGVLRARIVVGAPGAVTVLVARLGGVVAAAVDGLAERADDGFADGTNNTAGRTAAQSDASVVARGGRALLNAEVALLAAAVQRVCLPNGSGSGSAGKARRKAASGWLTVRTCAPVTGCWKRRIAA